MANVGTRMKERRSTSKDRTEWHFVDIMRRSRFIMESHHIGYTITILIWHNGYLSTDASMGPKTRVHKQAANRCCWQPTKTSTTTTMMTMAMIMIIIIQKNNIIPTVSSSIWLNNKYIVLFRHNSDQKYMIDDLTSFLLIFFGVYFFLSRPRRMFQIHQSPFDRKTYIKIQNSIFHGLGVFFLSKRKRENKYNKKMKKKKRPL